MTQRGIGVPRLGRKQAGGLLDRFPAITLQVVAFDKPQR